MVKTVLENSVHGKEDYAVIVINLFLLPSDLCINVTFVFSVPLHKREGIRSLREFRNNVNIYQNHLAEYFSFKKGGVSSFLKNDKNVITLRTRILLESYY